jgi:hypothetical protein
MDKAPLLNTVDKKHKADFSDDESEEEMPRKIPEYVAFHTFLVFSSNSSAFYAGNPAKARSPRLRASKRVRRYVLLNPVLSRPFNLL